MKIHKHSVKLLLVTIGIFISGFCFSQITDVTDSTTIRFFAATRGDTLAIRYDSAYILNRRTYKILHDNYIKVKNGNPALKELINKYEDLISLQDSMLKAKEMYYQGLKSSFDSLAFNANTFVNRTDLNITAIDRSLATATAQINSIKGLIDDSLVKLKLENKQRLKLAVGGFAIGVGVTTLVFLIAK